MCLGSMGKEGTVSCFLQMLKTVANVEKCICCCGGEEATRAWNEQKARRNKCLPAPVASEALSHAPSWRGLPGCRWQSGNGICRLLWEWASLDRVQGCSYPWEVMRPLWAKREGQWQNPLSATSKTEIRGGLPATSPKYGFDSSIVNLRRQKHCFSFFQGWKLKEWCLGNETALWKKKMSMFARAGSEAKGKPW